MDNMIVIDNLSFRYDNNIVFKNLSLCIRRGSFTTVLGNNGSGKSTLVKLLTGRLKSNSIFIDGKLNSFSNIGVVYDNSDFSLVSETVMDSLAFPLENLNCARDYIFSRINEVSSYLGIGHLLNRSCSSLSGGEKSLVCLGCALITGPKLLILDEAFSMISDIDRVNVLMYLRRINKDFGITILNFTHDIEESVYGDDILILSRGVLIHDSRDKVYSDEKLLRSNGFDLPFMVSLSNKLSYYDMVDSIIFDMDEMVDLLWK